MSRTRKPAARFTLAGVVYEVGYNMPKGHLDQEVLLTIRTPTGTTNKMVVDNYTEVVWALSDDSGLVGIENSSLTEIKYVQIHDVTSPECTLPLNLSIGQNRWVTVPAVSGERRTADGFTWSMLHNAADYWPE